MTQNLVLDFQTLKTFQVRHIIFLSVEVRQFKAISDILKTFLNGVFQVI